jgi:hypothetical protein
VDKNPRPNIGISPEFDLLVYEVPAACFSFIAAITCSD